MKETLRNLIPEKILHQARIRRQPLFRRMAAEAGRHAACIRQVLERHAGSPVFVYLPTVDWSFLRQRPQQLALALARAGCLFFYMSPCNRSDDLAGLREEAPGLHVCRFDYRLFREFINPIVWVSWTINRRFLGYFGPHRLAYDLLDELEVFDGYGPAMERDHRWLVRNADTVFAVSGRLLESMKRVRPDAVLCPNGADAEHFARTPSAEAPDDMTPALTGTRVIGCIGALARWIDYGRLRAAARHDPGWRIVLIGPDYDGTVKESGLLEEPNVLWLGEKDYHVLPDYLSRFDVALVPFRQDLALTHSVSPIKLYEYAAAGVPIVATDMAECRGIREVAIGATDAEFIQQIERAGSGVSEEELRVFARNHSWDNRARTILAALGITTAPGGGSIS